MKKIIEFIFILLVLVSCQKSEKYSNPEELMDCSELLLSRNGNWFLTNVLVNGIDTLSALTKNSDNDPQSIPLQFRPKKESYRPIIHLQDMDVSYQCTGGTVTITNSSWNCDCNSKHHCMKNPFIWHTAPETFDVIEANDTIMVWKQVKNTNEYKLKFRRNGAN